MGCHTWIYKKISSIPKQTLDENLKDFIEKESNSWIGKSSREEYAKELFDSVPEMLSLYEGDTDMCTRIKENYKTIDKCRKIWDDWHNKFSITKEHVNRFIENKDINPKGYFDIIKSGGLSAPARKYKGNYYVNTTFDTYFRCYSYSNKPIDSYEKMIVFLESIHPSMVCRYGTFDTNGIFHYCDDKEIQFGVTEELKDLLKFLYKDNDIFIEFG